jgi:hypothetical protein
VDELKIRREEINRGDPDRWINRARRADNNPLLPRGKDLEMKGPETAQKKEPVPKEDESQRGTNEPETVLFGSLGFDEAKEDFRKKAGPDGIQIGDLFFGPLSCTYLWKTAASAGSQTVTRKEPIDRENWPGRKTTDALLQMVARAKGIPIEAELALQKELLKGRWKEGEDFEAFLSSLLEERMLRAFMRTQYGNGSIPERWKTKVLCLEPAAAVILKNYEGAEPAELLSKATRAAWKVWHLDIPGDSKEK